MNPVVSIIIPVYNQAHYLPCAIRSVLAQTFTHWETIIVDDGSTDNTQAVAARYVNSNIHYLYQVNQGLSAARNAGICAARGDYLAFLDSDDELEPGFLHFCLAALTEDKALAAVYTQIRFIDGAGNVLPLVGGRSLSGESFRQQLLQGGFFPPVSVLVRTDVVREVGLFDVQLSGSADWDLWLRISKRYPMSGLPMPLVRYRVYPGSMSTNVARMQADRIAAVAKQVGRPEGNPATWPAEKRRMVGFVYYTSALDFMLQKQPETGWEYLRQAILIWPALLTRMDTFYEIACGDQVKGYRGHAALLDIEANGAEMLKQLDGIFAQSEFSLKPMRRTAYANAYLALGMLSDQADQWTLARRYLWRALAFEPQRVFSGPFVRRLLKLYTGQRLIRFARRVRGQT
jgi:glycosyltransferase involved in cell wall biosynthesis